MWLSLRCGSAALPAATPLHLKTWYNVSTVTASYTSSYSFLQHHAAMPRFFNNRFYVDSKQ